MDWYKIVLPDKPDVAVKGVELYKQFNRLFMGSSGPRNMTLYADKNEVGPSRIFYLTPACKTYAKAIIDIYAAESCEPPPSDMLRFLVGDSSYLR